MTLNVTTKVIDGGVFETIRYPTDEILLRAVSQGEIQVIEYSSEDRDGPPPHCHEWDEIEYVIEGEVEFYTAGSWERGGPGTVQVLAAGDAHSVRVPEGSARLLMVTVGAPYDGFARDVAALTDGQIEGDLVEVCARHGVRMGGRGA
jgi:quercetin dioxygenase-like cupin family protein